MVSIDSEPEKSEDKPGKPRLVIPVRFWGFLAEKGNKQKTRNKLGLQAWEAQAYHPSRFLGFLAGKGQKTLKRTGMTSLGSPGLSS